MKKLYFLFLASLVLTLLATPVFAQEEQGTGTEEKPAKEKKEKKEWVEEFPEKGFSKPRIKWGVVGSIHTGATLGAFGNLESDLQNQLTLGPNFSISMLGSMYGGHVDFFIGRFIAVGIGGTGMSFNASESEQGQASLKNMFGTGRVGVVAVHRAYYSQSKHRWSVLFYPYVGGGFGVSNMTLSNFSATEISLGNELIDVANFKEFSSTTGLIEFGASSKFFLSRKGSFSIGAELGGYINVGGSKWENEAGQEVNTNSASLAGGYLRFTVGGGFLSLQKSGSGEGPATDSSEPMKEKKIKKKKGGEATEEGSSEPASSGTPSEEASSEEKPKKEKKAKAEKPAKEGKEKPAKEKKEKPAKEKKAKEPKAEKPAKEKKEKPAKEPKAKKDKSAPDNE